MGCAQLAPDPRDDPVPAPQGSPAPCPCHFNTSFRSPEPKTGIMGCIQSPQPLPDLIYPLNLLQIGIIGKSRAPASWILGGCAFRSCRNVDPGGIFFPSQHPWSISQALFPQKYGSGNAGVHEPPPSFARGVTSHLLLCWALDLWRPPGHAVLLPNSCIPSWNGNYFVLYLI